MEPGPLPNGVGFPLSRLPVNPGSKHTFRCRNGYRINGSATVTCQNDGTWSTFPTCEANPGKLDFHHWQSTRVHHSQLDKFHSVMLYHTWVIALLNDQNFDFGLMNHVNCPSSKRLSWQPIMIPSTTVHFCLAGWFCEMSILSNLYHHLVYFFPKQWRKIPYLKIVLVDYSFFFQQHVFIQNYQQMAYQFIFLEVRSMAFT